MGVPIEIAPGKTELETLAIALAQPLEVGRLSGRIKELIASGEFRGDRAEALTVHFTDDAGRIILAGLGQRADVDLDAFRTAGAVAAQALAKVGGTLGWQLDESLPIPLGDQARALGEGTIIGGYTPGRWKPRDTEKLPRQIERIVIAHTETQELREAAE